MRVAASSGTHAQEARNGEGEVRAGRAATTATPSTHTAVGVTAAVVSASTAVVDVGGDVDAEAGATELTRAADVSAGAAVRWGVHGRASTGTTPLAPGTRRPAAALADAHVADLTRRAGIGAGNRAGARSVDAHLARGADGAAAPAVHRVGEDVDAHVAAATPPAAAGRRRAAAARAVDTHLSRGTRRRAGRRHAVSVDAHRARGTTVAARAAVVDVIGEIDARSAATRLTRRTGIAAAALAHAARTHVSAGRTRVAATAALEGIEIGVDARPFAARPGGTVSVRWTRGSTAAEATDLRWSAGGSAITAAARIGPHRRIDDGRARVLRVRALRAPHGRHHQNQKRQNARYHPTTKIGQSTTSSPVLHTIRVCPREQTSAASKGCLAHRETRLTTSAEQA